jgi:histone acetyltransferase
MPKDRWSGFIKDYDGGTLMECYVHAGMDYLRVPEIIAKQRAFILDRLHTRTQAGSSSGGGNSGSSNSSSSSFTSFNDVYDGLELFRNGQRIKNVMEVPGVASAGWKLQHLFSKPPIGGVNGMHYGTSERDRDNFLSKLASQMKTLVDKLISSKNSWPFLDPVNKKEVS